VDEREVPAPIATQCTRQLPEEPGGGADVEGDFAEGA
jgi:hypothetical protein